MPNSSRKVVVAPMVVKKATPGGKVMSFLASIVALSIVFGLIYMGLYKGGVDSFNMPFNRSEDDDFNFFYFSFSNCAYLGYGEMYPVSRAGKFLVCIQLFFALAILITTLVC